MAATTSKPAKRSAESLQLTKSPNPTDNIFIDDVIAQGGSIHHAASGRAGRSTWLQYRKTTRNHRRASIPFRSIRKFLNEWTKSGHVPWMSRRRSNDNFLQ